MGVEAGTAKGAVTGGEESRAEAFGAPGAAGPGEEARGASWTRPRPPALAPLPWRPRFPLPALPGWLVAGVPCGAAGPLWDHESTASARAACTGGCGPAVRWLLPLPPRTWRGCGCSSGWVAAKSASPGSSTSHPSASLAALAAMAAVAAEAASAGLALARCALRLLLLRAPPRVPRALRPPAAASGSEAVSAAAVDGACCCCCLPSLPSFTVPPGAAPAVGPPPLRLPGPRARRTISFLRPAPPRVEEEEVSSDLGGGGAMAPPRLRGCRLQPATRSRRIHTLFSI